MSFQTIVEAIDDEIQKLQSARALIVSVAQDKTLGASVGRRRKITEVTAVSPAVRASTPVPIRGRGRRKMSEAARKKIADAQRKRWAAQKALQSKSKAA